MCEGNLYVPSTQRRQHFRLYLLFVPLFSITLLLVVMVTKDVDCRFSYITSGASAVAAAEEQQEEEDKDGDDYSSSTAGCR